MIPHYSKGALSAATEKEWADATPPIMALSWLDSRGCALLCRHMGDVWDFSPADYMHDNITPEDKLALLTEEFSVVTTLLKPRAIRVVENPSEVDQDVKHEYGMLLFIQGEILTTISEQNWSHRRDFSPLSFLHSVDPDAQHVKHHVPALSIGLCEAVLRHHKRHIPPRYSEGQS